MEVVAAPPSGGVPPFCDHDVREWSRIDDITGAFERARLETDRWAASVGNTSYKYGKVVGSKNLTAADGGLQQSAKRQLEVFQGRVAGAQLHLVRSSSQWTSASSFKRTGNGDFENLQLSLNPLDLTSQKSRASVGRSVSRRPPTRHRLKDQQQAAPATDAADPLRHAHLSAAANLRRVSRLCHQLHDSAVRQAFGSARRPTIAERQDGDGRVEIVEIEGGNELGRTKSTSSDDLSLVPEKDGSGNRSVEDLEDLEQLQTWRRTSKLRRSLQFPKQSKPEKLHDLPENIGSVRKLREDLEKGRRLNTALRNNSVDLEALDQILQSISSSSTGSEKTTEDGEGETPTKQKRNSFVTVESIKEVKGRLRRTSSPSSDIYKVNGIDEDPDDGIVTEEPPPDKETDMPLVENSRVRSYVYGMEAMLNKKPGIGTGSLESRVKLVNGNASANRNEDWYNRRKSYGFEQVHGHSESTNSISLRDKKLVESSTDSGICRSTEIVVVPTARKNGYTSDEQSDSEKSSGYEHRNHARIHTGQVRKLANTFVQDEKISYPDCPSRYPNEWSYPKTELKSTTITIPIAKNNNVVELSWTDPDKETKRHSIAVDESKYVSKFGSASDEAYRRTSLASNDQFLRQDDDDANARRPKKVEFCKTEVHFAAESGKVNIVATDEKPPPTQNFRRRRRNSGPTLEDFNKNGLPVRHFGDSTYEKTMFGLASDDPAETSIYENVRPPSQTACGLVTVSTKNSLRNSDATDDDKKELDNELKGILKNKPVKPRPYHLGQEDGSATDDDNKWGVKLRHVEPETPIWKSTVTVQNYNYIKVPEEEANKKEAEFQQLLKNLRPVRKNDYASDSGYVEDAKRPLEDGPAVEVKGYSTKINFIGEGEATVVKNNEADRLTAWPKTESTGKASKQLLKRGLVVRIGRQDSATNHTVCSKMTTTRDPNNTTTTTTKITIDLSPSPPPAGDTFRGNFKSTSLILNTINRDKTERRDEIPKQLEALKRLYEDVQSDTEADKEVQLLMCNMGGAGESDRGSSEVSGSWSKMRAYKNLSERFGSGGAKGCDSASAKVEKDSKDRLKPPDNPTKINVNLTSVPDYSPLASRKSLSVPARRPDLNHAEKLSSPSIVNRNKTAEKDDVRKHPSDNVVLRQPKKSEMTYFGVNVSPRPTKKISQHAVIRKETKSSDKPDLIRHHEKAAAAASPRPRRKTPEEPAAAAPVYENIKNRYGRDFDGGILEELTKAADQILQAVNGYTDEDSHDRLTSDEEEEEEEEEAKKRHLDTIVEAKSWKLDGPQSTDRTKSTPSKPNLKHTPSNSSADSSGRRRTAAAGQKPRPAAAALDQKPRRRTEKPETSSGRAATKARRLQRASSREALLQGHGSSSEDLPAKAEVPMRKPRLVKKAKAAAQPVAPNGGDSKKSLGGNAGRKRGEGNAKAEERILGSLPEIRHKTAISTIRSTSEKVARDKTTKHTRNEDAKKKQTQQKKETSKVSSLSSRGEKEKTVRPATVCNNKETVTHRISTANIKKCCRTTGDTRH